MTVMNDLFWWQNDFKDLKEVTYTDKRINQIILKPGVSFSNEEYKKSYELYLENVIKPLLKEYNDSLKAGFTMATVDF